MWEEVQSHSLDGEMSAIIVGVEAQMITFEFLFGISIGLLVMCHTDSLSKSLQQERLSAAQAQRLAKLTLSVLDEMRADDQFSAFYQHVIQEQVRLGVADPVLPRKHHVPTTI